jgi:hypothetical protein
MAFSLSGGAAGAMGGAGTGAMFGGFGAPIGAGIGAILGGFFQSEEPSYVLSPEQQQLENEQRAIANGSVESPETLALRAQSNKNFSQIAGAMNANRGATAGAKGAYLAGLGAQNQAQTNEAAVASNANARRQASQFLSGLYGQQSQMKYDNELNQANRDSQFLGSMTQLGAFGASQYLKNKNKVA